MNQYVVKQSVYTDGQTVVTGRYITHDDKQRTIEYIGIESEGNQLIQRLKNNGSEFQHVRIMER